MLIARAAENVDIITLWGLAATAVMTSILYGSQNMGLSRLSLPFLVGTFFSSDRHVASLLGLAVYLFGGWAFALFYFLLFSSVQSASWWAGALVGMLHGLFVLSVLLPVLPYLHPRMATEYDGPTSKRRLEPPGFLGINYGRRTPLTTLFGHALYGLLLGFGFSGHVG